ncbi:MAG: mechanosensitive ion channel family protein [Eubacteriales bacterium]|nr:mechanosensitive ion channel family protein [Eubacteriales bacterium]
MEAILTATFYHNTVQQYLIFLGCLLLGLIAIRLITKAGLKRLGAWKQKSKKPIAGMLMHSVQKYIVPILYFTAIVLCTKILTLSTALNQILNTGIKLFATVVGGLFLSHVVTFAIAQYWRQHKYSRDSKVALHWITGTAKFIIWSVIVILFLQNIGVKIDALIAGLGISGLAIAFAAQVVLEDVFCYFTIFFDRPFELGDYIVVGEQMGTVEHIGVKTTRLRALDGEQLVLSNKDLTSSRIQNYKTMEKRRVVLHLGVTYDTPADTMQQIPGIIKEIIQKTPDTEFARAHFYAFNDSSLDFEIVYFILSSDYDLFMDRQQEVGLKVKALFDERGINFAFPTQTLEITGKVTQVAEGR